MSLHRKQQINEVLLWARGIVERDNYVILDTESTGKNVMDDAICEIAIVDRRPDPVLNRLVNPGLPIPHAAQAIHHISDAMVQGSPSLSDLYPKIAEAIEGKELVVFNLGYDMPLIESCLIRVGVQKLYGRSYFKPASVHCLMMWYAQYYGEVSYRGGYKWKSLTSAAYAFMVNIDNAHRALGDCHMAQGVLHALARKPLLDIDG